MHFAVVVLKDMFLGYGKHRCMASQWSNYSACIYILGYWVSFSRTLNSVSVSLLWSCIPHSQQAWAMCGCAGVFTQCRVTVQSAVLCLIIVKTFYMSGQKPHTALPGNISEYIPAVMRHEGVDVWRKSYSVDPLKKYCLRLYLSGETCLFGFWVQVRKPDLQ